MRRLAIVPLLLVVVGCNEQATLVSTSPANGATGVPIDSTISMTFSEIRSGWVDQAAFTLVSAGGPVSGTAFVSGVTFTFTPASALEYDTTYTATLSRTNAGGNDNVPPHSWTFTTEPPPPPPPAPPRFVAFHTFAGNLVPGDTNGTYDVYVHDLETGQTERVSVRDDGTGGSTESMQPSISADGRFVAFQSHSALVSNDLNGTFDVYVRDRQLGTTRCVSVNPSGAAANFSSFAPAISKNGRFVAFHSQAFDIVPGSFDGKLNVYVRDLETNTTTLVSVNSAGQRGVDSTPQFDPYLSTDPSLSDDGRFVVFYSRAANLVPDDTNGVRDVFVHDRETGETTRVSVSSSGAQGNARSGDPNQIIGNASISADGRHVAFWSEASNLVTDDTNGFIDCFAHDRATGATTRVSVRSGGAQIPDEMSFLPALSSDGRYVTFMSYSETVISGDSNGWVDVFVHDRVTGDTRRVSVGADGSQAMGGPSGLPSLSALGAFVVFASGATSGLLPTDANGQHQDIFIKNLATGEIRRVNVSSSGVQADNFSFWGAMSGD